MKPDIIKAIFTNLLFVIGVILIIFGFINGSLTATRLFTFQNYPLDSYQETRCEMEYSLTRPVGVDGEFPQPSPEELAKQKEKCLESLDFERRVRKTEDIVSSLTTLVAGIVLIWSFKKFIFK